MLYSEKELSSAEVQLNRDKDINGEWGQLETIALSILFIICITKLTEHSLLQYLKKTYTQKTI